MVALCGGFVGGSNQLPIDIRAPARLVAASALFQTQPAFIPYCMPDYRHAHSADRKVEQLSQWRVCERRLTAGPEGCNATPLTWISSRSSRVQ